MKRSSVFQLIAVFVAVLIGIGTYSYLSPTFTIRKIEAAARAKDTEELRDLIDLDSLKAGLKEDFRTNVAETTLSNPNATGFDVMGIALAGALIDPMIDSLVTPSSILRIISGHIFDKKQVVQRELAPTEASYEPAIEQQGYDNLSRYRFAIRSAKPGSQETIGLILKRQGFVSWRLTRVILPPSFFEAQDSISFLSIEESALDADKTNPAVMVLTTTLRNKATKALPFPAIELTLTKEGDEPVVRRVIYPADYAEAESRSGAIHNMRAKSEYPVKLFIEGSGVRATGYRLYLFYSSQDTEIVGLQLRPDAIKILKPEDVARLIRR